jgi:transcriptional regulator with XRE-family HTH domain
VNPDRERDYLTALGQRVRLLLVEQYLTQQQLADAAGMSRSFVSVVEHGAGGVDVVRLLRLATALGVPLSRVLPDEETYPAA